MTIRNFPKPLYAIRTIVQEHSRSEYNPSLLTELQAALGSVPQYNELTYTKYIGTLVFSNTGGKRLQSVQLRIPGAFRVTISRDGQPAIEHTFKGVQLRLIEIGNMNHHASCDVQFWTSKPIEDIRKDLKLVHNEGAGVIVFELPAHQFVMQLTEGTLFYTVLLASIVIGVVVWIIGFYS